MMGQQVIYPLWKQSLIAGDANAALSGTVRAVLLQVGNGFYVYSAGHQFYSTVQPYVQAGPLTLTGKTFTNGFFAASSPLLFTGLGSNPFGAVVLFIDTGTAASSRLLFYDDTLGGFPATLPSGQAMWNLDPAGIFAL